METPNKPTPKEMVTVVIPTYNQDQLLFEMIDDMKNQTYSDWKLLIIEDGSEEAIIQKIENYIEDFPKIHLIRRNRLPKGGQTCRNIGLELCTSKYIIFFDSDDRISPVCLEQRVKYMESHPELDFGVFPAQSYTPQNSNANNMYWGKPTHKEVDDFRCFLRNVLPFGVWTNIYRTSSLKEKALIWDEKVKSSQDSVFNIQNIANGLKYDYSTTAEIDYLYRIQYSKKSIGSMITNPKHFDSHLYMLSKIIDEVQKKFGHDYDKELVIRILSFGLKMVGTKEDNYIKELINLFGNVNASKWLRYRFWLFHKLKQPKLEYSPIFKSLSFIFFPMLYNQRKLSKCLRNPQ